MRALIVLSDNSVRCINMHNFTLSHEILGISSLSAVNKSLNSNRIKPIHPQFYQKDALLMTNSINGKLQVIDIFE